MREMVLGKKQMMKIKATAMTNWTARLIFPLLSIVLFLSLSCQVILSVQKATIAVGRKNWMM